MARNPSGTFTLSPGNPVVTATTITSTWANQTLSDIASAITDSLDRNGRGEMLAPLVVPAGTPGATTIRFTGDPNSGLYQGGQDDVRMSIGGSEVGRWTAGGYSVTGALSASVSIRFPDGLVGAPGAVLATEPTTGLYKESAGVLSVSVLGSKKAALSSTGLVVTGDIEATQNLKGASAEATGAAGKPGVQATGGAGFAGAVLANGTAATAAVRQTACKLSNGDLDMSSVPNPNSNVAIVNKITPASTHKAFARIQTDGVGGVSLLGGMNIASVSIGGAGAYVSIILAGPMADLVNHSINALQYAAGAMGWAETYGGSIQGGSFNEIRVYGLQTTIGGPPTTSAINFSTSVRNFYVDIVGRQ